MMAAVMRPVLARIRIWFAVAALLGTATVFLREEEKVTDGNFASCITKPYVIWGKDHRQEGLAAGRCSGEHPHALSLIPAGLLGLLLLEQSLELS